MKQNVRVTTARRNYRGPRKGDALFWRWGDWKRQKLYLLDYPQDTAISRLILYHCRLGGNFHTNSAPTYKIDHRAEALDHLIQELEDKYQATLMVYYNAIDPTLQDMLRIFHISQRTFYYWLEDAHKELDNCNKLG